MIGKYVSTQMYANKWIFELIKHFCRHKPKFKLLVDGCHVWTKNKSKPKSHFHQSGISILAFTKFTFKVFSVSYMVKLTNQMVKACINKKS